MTDLLLEEEAVGAVSAVPGRRAGRGANATTAAQQARQAVDREDIGIEEDQQSVEASDEEGDGGALEEVKSPSKIRRIQRSAAAPAPAGRSSKAGASKTGAAKTGAAGKAGKAAAKGKGGKTSRGRGKQAEGSESEGSEESAESGEGEGMIELDNEEAAAFANLGLHDAEDDDA